MVKYVAQAGLAAYREENIPVSCPILGHTEFSPVVDHDHKTGRIRGVVSLEGNALLGKIENFFHTRCVNATKNLPEVLRRLAEYLEFEQGPLHPVGLRQVTKRFLRLSKEEQFAIISELGGNLDEAEKCKNTKERTKLYRKLLIN